MPGLTKEIPLKVKVALVLVAIVQQRQLEEPGIFSPEIRRLKGEASGRVHRRVRAAAAGKRRRPTRAHRSRQQPNPSSK